MDTNNDIATVIAASLSASQVAALRLISVPQQSHIDLLGCKFTLIDLENRGLVEQIVYTYELTDLGNRVLSALAVDASGAQVATITASQWDTVAEAVKEGRCIVTYAANPKHIIDVIPDNSKPPYTMSVNELGGTGWRGSWHTEFTVRWLTPPTATAATAEGEAIDSVALHRAEIARLRGVLETIRDYPEVEAEMELGHQVAGMVMQSTVALEADPPQSGLLTILAQRNEELRHRLQVAETALAESTKRVDEVEREYASELQFELDTFDKIWGIVTGNKIGNWDYPAQVVRHVEHMRDDFTVAETALESEKEANVNHLFQLQGVREALYSHFKRIGTFPQTIKLDRQVDALVELLDKKDGV